MRRTVFFAMLVISMAAIGSEAQSQSDQTTFIFATIEGESAGNLSAGASSRESIGHFAHEDHKDEITVLGFNDGAKSEIKYNHEFDVFDLNGYLSLENVTFLKHVDRAAPLIEKAMREFERTTITFSYYRRNASNEALELILTQRFEQCFITGSRIIVPNQAEGAHHGAPMMQEVTFVFRQVTVTFPKTGESATLEEEWN